mmetsp:Transcript_50873/g.94147  ORF Transcript_50873/g.94147 Transcript_50873/m.94147 type:complete len:292 (-) Transcript_50873:277-1152(-)
MIAIVATAHRLEERLHLRVDVVAGGVRAILCFLAAPIVQRCLTVLGEAIFVRCGEVHFIRHGVPLVAIMSPSLAVCVLLCNGDEVVVVVVVVCWDAVIIVHSKLVLFRWRSNLVISCIVSIISELRFIRLDGILVVNVGFQDGYFAPKLCDGRSRRLLLCFPFDFRLELGLLRLVFRCRHYQLLVLATLVLLLQLVGLFNFLDLFLHLFEFLNLLVDHLRRFSGSSHSRARRSRTSGRRETQVPTKLLQVVLRLLHEEAHLVVIASRGIHLLLRVSRNGAWVLPLLRLLRR